jgi:hypothetical protein
VEISGIALEEKKLLIPICQDPDMVLDRDPDSDAEIKEELVICSKRNNWK